MQTPLDNPPPKHRPALTKSTPHRRRGRPVRPLRVRVRGNYAHTVGRNEIRYRDPEKELAPKPATNNLGGQHVRRGAGLSSSTERHSASQATSGSKQSGHAVDGGAARAAISWAAISWATPRHRRRSRADICDQACGRPSLSVEIHVRRAAARRFFPTSGFSTERIGGPNSEGVQL